MTEEDLIPLPTGYPLVEADWLMAQTPPFTKALPDGSRLIALLDCSYYLPNSGRNAEGEFHQCHIPGAQFFDVDLISNPDEIELPHMVPNEPRFQSFVDYFDISRDSFVVIYDSSGLFSAARAWWMFRLFGHKRVGILQGGLKAWQAKNLPTISSREEAENPAWPPPLRLGGEAQTHLPSLVKAELTRKFIHQEPLPQIRVGYEAEWQPRLLVKLDKMEEIVHSQSHMIIDARSPGRFQGKEPEPRIGLSSGHMRGAKNFPVSRLTDSDSGLLRPLADLRREFSALGVNFDQPLQPIVVTCGSGVSAPALAFVLALLGKPQVAVYDGSWSEWARHSQREIIKDS